MTERGLLTAQAVFEVIRKKHMECASELLSPEMAQAFISNLDQDLRSV